MTDVSEAGSLVLETKDGGKEFIGGKFTLESVESPDFVMETRADKATVSSLNDSELDSEIDRQSKKFEEVKDANEVIKWDTLRILNALKLEKKRRAKKEAADIYEVFRTMLWAWNLDYERVLDEAHKKRSKRGSFLEGIVLEKVHER